MKQDLEQDLGLDPLFTPENSPKVIAVTFTRAELSVLLDRARYFYEHGGFNEGRELDFIFRESRR